MSESMDWLRVGSGRDWPEDFGFENGNYQCRCVFCGEFFTGHKRRFVCKSCDGLPKTPIDPPKPMTPEFQRLFSGYFCVFVGDPKRCVPYVLCAGEGIALAIKREINGSNQVMTVEEWAAQYENTQVAVGQSCKRCGERIRGQSYQACGGTVTVCGLCYDDILNGK